MADYYHNLPNRKIIQISGAMCIAFSLLYSAPIHAQDTLSQQKGFIRKAIDLTYKIIQGDTEKPRNKYFLIIPMISYKPETRWIIGLSNNLYFRPTVKDSSETRLSFARINIAYSQNRQFSFWPRTEIFTKNNVWWIRAQYQFTDFSEYYWGIGINQPDEVKQMYAFNMHRVNARISRLFAKNFYTGVHFNLEQMGGVDYRTDSSMLELSGVPGNAGYYASGIGANVSYDSRDNVVFPFNGLFLDLQYTYFSNWFGGDYIFHNLVGEARYFKTLWKENVIALQGYANINSTGVPFRMMGTLGNEYFLRGYYSGRYRDLDALAFQAEFRKTLFEPINAVVFAGLGTVSPNIVTSIPRLKPAMGLGLRIKAIPRERVNVRLDFAIGVDGSRTFYLNLNEAF